MFLLWLLFICIFVVIYKSDLIIEGLDSDGSKDCDKNGYANSDFNEGMQYALDKKLAKVEKASLNT